MSEQRDDAPGVDDADTDETEVDPPEPDEVEGEEEGEEDAPPPRAAKPVDWEKRAHSNAGQAARERSRRQAAERRSQELESRMESLERRSGGPGDDDELLALIGHLRDDDEDPVGDIAAVKRALKLYRARELTSVEESRQMTRAQREVETLKGAMSDSEADFAAENPDYHDAAKFYREARSDELKEIGYSGDALQAKLANDLFSLVRTAFSTGMDPAERVYNLAKKRGFKVGAKAADKKLEALGRAAESGVRPQARSVAGVLSWGDVAKLDGAARDKAFKALREREMARK